MRILLNIPLSPRLSPFNVNQEKDIRKIKKKKKSHYNRDMMIISLITFK